MWNTKDPVTKETCGGIYKIWQCFLVVFYSNTKTVSDIEFIFLLLSPCLTTRNSLLSMCPPCTHNLSFPLLSSFGQGLGLRFIGREFAGFCCKHAKSASQSIYLSIGLSGIDSCVWLSLSYHCAVSLISSYSTAGLCFSLKQLSEEMWEASLHHRLSRYLWRPSPLHHKLSRYLWRPNPLHHRSPRYLWHPSPLSLLPSYTCASGIPLHSEETFVRAFQAHSPASY